MALPAKQSDARPDLPVTTDGELVMRFVRQRDRAAIGELVHKHAPMVMAVCRQVLGSRPDAEDAFQATFLILVKRADTIERKSSVAGWLNRVAHRTAVRLAVRRRRGGGEPLAAEPACEGDVFSIISQREMLRTLHDELARLPSRYREPILLSYFAGKTREEIAEELECTDAAVKGRLARGRKMLRLALARRGVGLSVAMGAGVAVAPTSAAAAVALADKTVLACTSILERTATCSYCSPQAIQLTQEGVRAMLISSLTKIVIAPAVVGIALVAFAQLPDEAGERSTTAAASGALVLAGGGDGDDSSASSGAVTIRAAEGDAAGVIASSGGGASLSADSVTLMAADPAGVSSSPPASISMPEADAATLSMLQSYYEQRARASDMRQDAKQVEIEAYSRSPGTDREELLSQAKRRELQADVLDLRAESELFSARARLLAERRERLESGAAGSAANGATLPSAVAPPDAQSVDTIQPGERVRIEAIGVYPDAPLGREYTVEESGNVPLGPTYGRVSIGGLSLKAAEQAIEEHLREYVQDPHVQVTRVLSDVGEAQLQSLRNEIRALQSELERLQGGPASASDARS